MHSFVRLLRSALHSLSPGGRGSADNRRRAAAPSPMPPVSAPSPPAHPPAEEPVPAAVAVEPDPEAELEPLPDLRLPGIPMPRLQLPALEPVPAVERGSEPITVAAFVAAELRSIPSQWIEEATGRLTVADPPRTRVAIGEVGAAVAVAAAPAVHPPVPARVRLVPLHPALAISEPAEEEEPPAGWPLAPAAIIRPCPLPSGAMLFGPLSSAYVDGPSLLRELGHRAHSGAVLSAGGGRAQAVILHRGEVLALVAAGRSGTRRIERLRLPVAGQEPEHDLTVPVYRPEVAVALAQLVNLPARFRRMHTSFIRMPELLDHLGETGMTGAVRVTTADDVGVLLLAGGVPLGAYTARRPELEDVEILTRLCATGDAEIDVHAAPAEGDPPSLGVERLLG